jgi:hypothetical protein
MKFRALNISYQLEASVRYASLNRKNPTILIQEGAYEQAINAEDADKNFPMAKTLLTVKRNHIAPDDVSMESIRPILISDTQDIPMSSSPQLAGKLQFKPDEKRVEILHVPIENRGSLVVQVQPDWLIQLFHANLRAVATKRLTAKSWWHDTVGRSLPVRRNESNENLIQASMNQTTVLCISQPWTTSKTTSVSNLCAVDCYEGLHLCQNTGLIVVGNKKRNVEVNRCMLQAIQFIMFILQNKHIMEETRYRHKALTSDVDGEPEENQIETICHHDVCAKRKREDNARSSNFPFKKQNCQVRFGTVTAIDSGYNHQFSTDTFIRFEEIRDDASKVTKAAREEVVPHKDSSHKLQKELKREERRLEKRKRKEKRSKQIREDQISSSTACSTKIPRVETSQVAVNSRYDASKVDDELDHARNALNNRAIESRKLYAETKLREVFRSSGTLTSKLHRHNQPGRAPHNARIPPHSVLNMSQHMATPQSQNNRGFVQQDLQADEARQKQGGPSQQKYEPSIVHKPPSTDNIFKLSSNVRYDALNHITISKEVQHNKTFNAVEQECGVSVSHTMANHSHGKDDLPQKRGLYGGNDSISQTRMGYQTTGEASMQPEYNNSTEQTEDPRSLYSDEQTSEAEGAMLPIKILCSEAFLETRGETVAELASGRWAHAWNDKNLAKIPNNSIGRKIMCIDTPLLESCGIHLEASNRCGMLIISAAQLENPVDAKQIVLSLAKLAAIGRYSSIQVFICCDSENTASITKHVIKLQFAASTSRKDSPTKVFCKTTTSTNLAASLAHTILCLPNMLDSCTNLECIQEGLVQDRISFLITLLPVMSVTAAIECLQLAKTLLSNDCPYFEILLKNQRLRQQMMLHAISNEARQALQPAALVQLSHVLRVVVGTEVRQQN